MIVNIFLFIFGAIIGSFLNVLIYRLPREESIVFPASHCPKCQTIIKWYDNIPILSFLLLCGKCRSCKAKISLRYPAVELLTGLFFLYLNASGRSLPSGLDYYFQAFFFCAMVVIFFSDYETEIIPDEIIILGVPLGLLWHFFIGDITASVVSCALGYSLLFLISVAAKAIYKKDALGYGDVKLAALMGAWLTFDKLLLALFLGYLIGALWALALLLLKIKKIGDYIPFGPALCTGALLAMYFGSAIISLYLERFF